MFSQFCSFNPRDYVIENLSLQKQAVDFVKIYEYWGLTIEDGYTEYLLNEKDYKELTVFKILIKIKNRIANNLLLLQKY